MNRLGVRAQGAEIVLMVNGQEGGRVRDDALVEGGFAFGVSHADGEHVEGRFNELLVTRPD